MTTAAIAYLQESALAVRAGGVSIIPINHRTKRPAVNFLPVSEDGKPEWAPFQSHIASEEEVRKWFSGGVQAYAGVCGAISGGLLIFDFDVPRFYELWIERVGELAADLPTQQTGGGGYQVALRCDDPGATLVERDAKASMVRQFQALGLDKIPINDAAGRPPGAMKGI